MSFNLESVFKGKINRPHRLLIYGEEKVGKTTFATQAPGAILLSMRGEEGADDMECAKFPVVTKMTDFQEAIEALCGEHDFQTLVIDSVSALEPLVQEHCCSRDKKANIEAYGFGKGYIIVENEMAEILNSLDYLRNQKNMTIIIIGHAKVRNFSDPAGDSYNRYELDCHKSVASMVQRWVDGIFFCKKKTISKTEEAKFNVKIKKAIRSEHVLYTLSQGSFPAGGRGVLGKLPPEMPLDYQVFEQELNNITKEN